MSLEKWDEFCNKRKMQWMNGWMKDWIEPCKKTQGFAPESVFMWTHAFPKWYSPLLFPREQITCWHGDDMVITWWQDYPWTWWHDANFFQKCSDPHSFLRFWSANRVLATVWCTFLSAKSGLHFADLIHVLFGKFLTKIALAKLYQFVPSSIKKYPIGG